MENIPKVIYLQIGEGFEPNEFSGDFSELSEVTWCQENIYDNDLVYLNKQYLRDYLNSHTVNDLCELIIN